MSKNLVYLIKTYRIILSKNLKTINKIDCSINDLWRQYTHKKY